jgi:hypothetical protein
MEFMTPADIGNRALQHCGADLMDATLGFSESSQRARAIGFCYGKLRRAELQRNAWTFATRKAALRPIDQNTMLIAPTLWSEVVTYFVGSIVSDASGTLWISRIPNNLANDPQNTSLWEPYFGPMTVSLYDSSQSYFSGELVYTGAGDGTYNVYDSRTNGNTVHPALPNQWSTDTTYAKNNVVQQFPAWAVGTTYAAGATVYYTDGNIYSSLTAGNVGHAPSASSAFWATMPTLTLASALVPVTATPIAEWQQQTTYGLGSFAMFNGSVYVSIAADNTGHFPNAAGSTSWARCTGGTLYMSLIDINIGNDPANTVALWSALTTYATGNQVGGSDGLIYTSLTNGNINHNPTTDDGTRWSSAGVYNPWTTVFTQGGGNSLWTQIGGAAFPNGVGLTGLNIIYPLDSGPSSQSGTLNVFRLPAGFLKKAPQDPKAGSFSLLGAPSGRPYDDWNIEGRYLTSRETGAIVLRFVADVQDVSEFHDMFCEGLACRIGLEVAEPLTQSTSKLATIAKMYSTMMTEARTVNAIEVGSEELPLDDFIACRA